MIWGISRYYFHFYMIHNFLIGCKTAIDKDHRSTMPCKHHLRLILIDAKREKKNSSDPVTLTETKALVSLIILKPKIPSLANSLDNRCSATVKGS